MSCPVCNYDYSDQHKFFTCESFDDSTLYKDVIIHKCLNCGHIYNILTKREIKGIKEYYNNEYVRSNLNCSLGSDRPGADNVISVRRYKKTFNFFVGYLEDENARILDIGCALGGFLRYMETKGYFNTKGIELLEDYVNNSGMENVSVGDVYNIPFPDNSFDLVVLDQVLEHLDNLQLAMKEVYRVLDKGGMLYIGVPNADEYNDLYFYISREHIQHFNLKCLKLLANFNGFEIVNHTSFKTNMIGSLDLPNLSVLLKKSGTTYCWGIGREFFYLYPNTRLKYMDLILVDDTPFKQTQTFKGMKIHSSDVLKNADKNSFLIITANVHTASLILKAQQLGYKGLIIEL